MTHWTNYRKKPVVIQAVQWFPGHLVEGVAVETNVPVPSRAGGTAFTIPEIAYIETLEGRMQVSPGDYVIRGVQGELYPCKPDIFAATYEVCEAESHD